MGPPTKVSRNPSVGLNPSAHSDANSIAPFTESGSIAKLNLPPGLATVTPLTPAALAAIQRNGGNVAQSTPSMRTGEDMLSLYSGSSWVPASAPPNAQFPANPSAHRMSAAAPQWVPQQQAQFPSPQPQPMQYFSQVPQAHAAQHFQYQAPMAQQFAAQAAGSSTGMVQHRPNAPQMAPPPQHAMSPMHHTHHIPSQHPTPIQMQPHHTQPAPVNYFSQYQPPPPPQWPPQAFTGFPADPQAYYEVPYGVPVAPPADFHYGLLPPEPLSEGPQKAAPFSGASVHRPSRSSSVPVVKPPRASDRRQARTTDHHPNHHHGHHSHHHHNAEAAAVVATAAAGLMAAGAVGAMLLL